MTKGVSDLELTQEDEREVLAEAKRQFKAEMVRQIVTRAFADHKERIAVYVQGESVKLGEELKKQMPL